MIASPDIAPDYIEPIRAWRAWRIVERDGLLLLGSAVKPTVWPIGRTLVAECLHLPLWRPWRRRHAPPHEHCACGIYGASLAQAAEYAHGALTRRSVGWAIGLVALWGTVLECERGFRASHAYPDELWIPWTERVDRRDAAERLCVYGAPVSLLDGHVGDAALLLAS